MNLTYIPLILGMTCMTSQAVITSIDTSTPTSSDYFSDGASDYFGIVSGGLIESTSFLGTLMAPEGALTGRDHDDGSSRPRQTTAEWSITLPADAVTGTGLTNISFNGILAAAQLSWDNSPAATNDDFVSFELLINGSVVETQAYLPNVAVGVNSGSLALDTNGDNVGDGTLISETGTMFAFSNVGGSTVTSVTLRGTFSANAGAEEHFTTGTLTADFDQVPEPSSFALLGLAITGLLTRRSRR